MPRMIGLFSNAMRTASSNDIGHGSSLLMSRALGGGAVATSVCETARISESGYVVLRATCTRLPPTKPDFPSDKCTAELCIWHPVKYASVIATKVHPIA